MSKFNTSNAANSIVNVIQTSIGNAAFDTTIRAIIQEKVDEATGKFKLQYQDGVFYAFADDVKINYSKGTEVFVLVPKNDFTQDKRIIGSVKTLGEDYVSVFTYDERYKKIGKSAFEENSNWFSIKSKTDQQQNTTLYSTEANAINWLTPDTNFLNYLKKEQVNGLWLEGTFKTYLNQIQDFNGANYGLRLTFSIGKDQDKKQHTVQLDANSMEGTPFNLSGNRQVIIFSGVDWSTVSSIDKIEFFAEGFSINSVEEDLFVKDIKMYAVSYISDEEQLKSGLTLSSPKGLYINEGAPIDLTATLRIDGKVQRDKVIYYWFIKDPTITANSNVTKPDEGESPILVYNAAGGPGWRCLNSATVKEEKVTTETKDENGNDTTSTETIYTINWADGTNTWTFDSEYIPSAQATIMCVAKFENTLYTDTITIYDNDQTEYFVLTASKEFFTKSEQEITLTLQEQELDDGQTEIDWQTYTWYQQDLYGGAPVEIEEAKNNTTFTVKGASIVNEATYMVVVQGTETNEGKTINHSFTTNPVTLSMRLDEQEEVPPQYTLTIINGDQVFQYSEEGYAPNSPAWVTHSPQDIKALSFVLFDNQLGAAVEAESQEWTIPESGTLLREKDGASETDDTYAFEIASMYNASYSNNQITLTVTYNGMTFTATTNFVFVKQGDPGTNGTEEVYWIQLTKGTGNASSYCYLNLYSSSQDPIATATFETFPPLKNEEGVLFPLENNFQISRFQHTDEGIQYVAPSGITYVADSQFLYFIAKVDGQIKAFYCTNWKDTAFLPTPLSQGQYIVYDADGQNPKYANSKIIDGIEIPIADKVKNIQDIKTYTAALAKNNGLTGITYEIKDSEGNITATYYITLYASLNRHAFSMVNGWDGNLKIDDSNNYMLAATVAAGKKNEDNTFTGVMIGTVGDSTNSQNNKTGFFGYNKGMQTAFIDAEDGSTRLGNSAHTLFQIGDNYSEEFLQSSNYQSGAEIRTVTLKDSSGVSTTYPSNQWSSNNIVVVYAESAHLTPVGVIKGTGYVTSFNEPTNIEYIKGYLGSSSTEKYIYVTGSTTTLYKGENFSYQLNPQKGMRIDLKNGSILAPGYYLNGTNGSATFEGTVKANSGEFNNVFIQKNCILQANDDDDEDDIEVGSMLASLNSKIESISFVTNNYTQTLASGNIFSLNDMGTIIGKIDGDHISYSGGKLKIAATEIASEIVYIKKASEDLSEAKGSLGYGKGYDGSLSTDGVILRAGADTGGSYSTGGYFVATSSGARMSKPTTQVANMNESANSVWVSSNTVQIDLQTGSTWKLKIGSNTYTIEIEE